MRQVISQHAKVMSIKYIIAIISFVLLVSISSCSGKTLATTDANNSNDRQPVLNQKDSLPDLIIEEGPRDPTKPDILSNPGLTNQNNSGDDASQKDTNDSSNNKAKQDNKSGTEGSFSYEIKKPSSSDDQQPEISTYAKKSLDDSELANPATTTTTSTETNHVESSQDKKPEEIATTTVESIATTTPVVAVSVASTAPVETDSSKDEAIKRLLDTKDDAENDLNGPSLSKNDESKSNTNGESEKTKPEMDITSTTTTNKPDTIISDESSNSKDPLDQPVEVAQSSSTSSTTTTTTSEPSEPITTTTTQESPKIEREEQPYFVFPDEKAKQPELAPTTTTSSTTTTTTAIPTTTTSLAPPTTTSEPSKPVQSESESPLSESIPTISGSTSTQSPTTLTTTTSSPTTTTTTTEADLGAKKTESEPKKETVEQFEKDKKNLDERSQKPKDSDEKLEQANKVNGEKSKVDVANALPTLLGTTLGSAIGNAMKPVRTNPSTSADKPASSTTTTSTTTQAPSSLKPVLTSGKNNNNKTTTTTTTTLKPALTSTRRSTIDRWGSWRTTSQPDLTGGVPTHGNYPRRRTQTSFSPSTVNRRTQRPSRRPVAWYPDQAYSPEHTLSSHFEPDFSSDTNFQRRYRPERRHQHHHNPSTGHRRHHPHHHHHHQNPFNNNDNDQSPPFRHHHNHHHYQPDSIKPTFNVPDQMPTFSSNSNNRPSTSRRRFGIHHARHNPLSPSRHDFDLAEDTFNGREVGSLNPFEMFNPFGDWLDHDFHRPTFPARPNQNSGSGYGSSNGYRPTIIGGGGEFDSSYDEGSGFGGEYPGYGSRRTSDRDGHPKQETNSNLPKRSTTTTTPSTTILKDNESSETNRSSAGNSSNSSDSETPATRPKSHRHGPLTPLAPRSTVGSALWPVRVPSILSPFDSLLGSLEEDLFGSIYKPQNNLFNPSRVKIEQADGSLGSNHAFDAIVTSPRISTLIEPTQISAKPPKIDSEIEKDASNN